MNITPHIEKTSHTLKNITDKYIKDNGVSTIDEKLSKLKEQ